MVTRMYERNEKLRLDGENAFLSNTNAIWDLQTMVTRMYERDEILRIESANVSLNNTNTIRDLKSMINRMYERDENLRIEVENVTTAIRDLQTMVTQLQKRDEELRLDGENASLSNNNAYAIRDLQTMVTELYERDEKLSLDWENATFLYTNAIRDLKTYIVELQAKVIDFTNSTTKVNDRLRNIYDLLKLSTEGKVLIQDEIAYFGSDKRLSWSEAWSFCRSKDAVLVNILDSSMNRIITTTLADYDDDFWIGGIKVPGSGVYSWKTESGYSPITWFNWAPGEPNRSTQSCIQLWKGQGHKWDNDHCSYLKRFLCSIAII